MDKMVSDYIDRQEPLQKEICLALRKILLKVDPEMKEEMKWGVIAYDNGRYYIGVVKHGVNLGFAIGGLGQEEIKQFEGNGKTMRNIKIESLEDIDRKKVTGLIELVKKKAICNNG